MILIALGLTSPVHADDVAKERSSPPTSCQTEIDKYCKDSARGPDTFRCLLKHESDASDACKREIQKLKQAIANTEEGNAPPFGGMGGGMGIFGPPSTGISYGGWYSPHSGSGDVQQHRANISVPVYKDDKDSVALSVGGSSLHFGEQLILSETGTQLPTDFYRIDFGGQYARKLENEKLIGGRIGFGTASDKPFESSKGTTIGASGFYSFPGSERSRWVLTLFYSNNNPIINYAPIPGFLYLYRTKTFTGMFGLPFASMQWSPIEPWAFSLSVFGPTISSEIAYGHRRGIQGFTAFNWGQQSFLREARANTDDRLFLDEKRTMLGLRTPIVDGLSGELQGGYVFDRSVYEGSRIGRKSGGSTELAASWFAGWNLRYVF